MKETVGMLAQKVCFGKYIVYTMAVALQVRVMSKSSPFVTAPAHTQYLYIFLAMNFSTR
jgi:hypothetical protein